MPIPIISLFNGCGGLDLGFTRAEFKVLLAIDADAVAVSTYNLNANTDTAVVADLAETSAESIIGMIEKKYPGFEPRGVIGGPPCQPFSNSNVSNGDSNGNGAKRELPGQYALLLKSLNEKYRLDFFVFENVRGLTFERHKADFARFKGLFEDAGFELFEGLLDAQFFGVAQKRPRVFVVGWNKDKYGEWDYRFPNPRPDPVKTVDDVIRELPDPVFYSPGLDSSSFQVHPNHWTMQPRSRRFKDGSLHEGQNRGRSFRVLSWAKPSWTVAYGNREIHIHPSATRRLSVYEAMLLQGFPREYILTGTFSQQVRQVSDAVPPPLAEALAVSIKEFIAGNPVFRIPSSTRQLHLLSR